MFIFAKTGCTSDGIEILVSLISRKISLMKEYKKILDKNLFKKLTVKNRQEYCTAVPFCLEPFSCTFQLRS